MGLLTKDKQKESEDRLDHLREGLVEAIGKALETDDPLQKAEAEKRNAEVNDLSEVVIQAIKENESAEVKALRERIEELEKLPEGDPRSLNGAKAAADGEVKTGKVERYKGENLFLDMKTAAQNPQLAAELAEYRHAIESEDRVKAWASGDLEDVDLILPEVQEALPFLHHATPFIQLCRRIKISSSSVEWPKYTSGLQAQVVAEMGAKPESDPTFGLVDARAFTIAGLTQVPNQTLEDYPAARAWIASELGYAVGAEKNRLALLGGGTGEPLGLLSDPDVPGRIIGATGSGSGSGSGSGAVTAKDIIEQVFVSIQRIRINGKRTPTDIALSPAVWTVIALAFETGVGWLYGSPQGSGSAPEQESKPVLLGLPVTQDPIIPVDQGTGQDESPIIVGNFQDAVVFDRTPFRVDVDTSLGFKNNSTWFRGEERSGFLVVRGESFEVIEGVKPGVIGPDLGLISGSGSGSGSS